MAEFALIVPVFLLLFVGITGFGQAFYYWLKTNHVANETARWAAVDYSPYGVSLQTHVTDEIGNSPGTTVTICPEDDTPGDGKPGVATVGKYITVSVAKPLSFKIHIPLIPALDTGFTIRGTSTQRVEQLLGPATNPDGSRIPKLNWPSSNIVGTCPT